MLKSKAERIPIGQRALNFAHYVLYLPYKGWAIMPYNLFQQRLQERCIEQRHWPRIAFRYPSPLSFQSIHDISCFVRALRIVFWMWLADCLHFVAYLRPISRHWAFLQYQFTSSRIHTCCLMFTLGIAFHLKYTVIWGTLNLFVEIDKCALAS